MMKTAPATLLLSAALAGTASAQDRPAEWTPPAADEATGQMCHLQYHHRGHAEPVDLTGTQCSAWSDNACCTFDIADAFKYDQADISGLYDGHGMGISACGIPSQACQKWMIAENCLYECDVNAGRYRHHVGDAACDDDGNEWQMSGFPVKGSEVAQFYDDCSADSFCFGTVDTCSGTIAGSDLADAEEGGDCAAYFASHTGWCDGCAACDGTDKEPCRAACPTGCTYAVESVTNDPGTCAESVSVAADAAACAAVTALDDAAACEAERTASTDDAAETLACTYTPGETDTPGTCAEAVSVAADAAACAAVTALGDAAACDAVGACTFTRGVAGSTTAGRGWWNRASGCESTPTGCKTMAEIYPGGGAEMVEELWAYGTDPAFVTVPADEQTATNSFSLFGGSATTDTDHTDAPLTQENPNDDVCLTGDCAKLFPAAPTCTHVTDCVNEVSACTSDCETAAQRTEVVTTAPTYGGAACADLSPTDCEIGDDQCAAVESPVTSTASAAAAGAAVMCASILATLML